MSGNEFDVIVVGGGVGGVAAVRKLASAGLAVALVEDRLVGGECHYWACNPTRTLLRPIEVFNLAKAVPGVREAISGDRLEVAAVFAGKMAVQARRFARRVPMEPQFAELLPEVLLGLGPAEFARIAALALAPRPVPVVSTEHIHTPRTSVREQTEILAGRLRTLGRATFRHLTSDCTGTYEVVARFLALLDLYRDGNVSFEQVVPLGDLYVTWAGDETGRSSTPGEEDDWS